MAALAAMIVIQAATYIPHLHGDLTLNQFNPYDCAAYACLGRSLAQGRGYTTRQEHDPYVPHKTWPPGQPLILAAGFLVHDSMWGPQAAMAAIALLNTLILWKLARRHLSPALSLLATATMAFSPVFSQLATVALAEQPVVAATLLSVLCFERWRQARYARGRRAWALAAVMGFGLMVKPIWIPMLLVFVIVAWADSPARPDSAAPAPSRGRRTLRACVVVSLGALPWLLWLVRGHFVHSTGYDAYTQIDTILTDGKVGGPVVGVGHILHSALNTIKWHVPARCLDTFAGAGWFLKAHAGVEPAPLAAIGIVAVFAAAWVYALIRIKNLRLITLAVALLQAPMILFPDGGSTRYWLHWTPLAAIFFLAVIQDLLAMLKHRAVCDAPACPARACRREYASAWHPFRLVSRVSLVLAFAVVAAIFTFDYTHRRPHGRDIWASFHDIAVQARQITGPDAVILSPFPNGVALLTGRAITDRTPEFRPLYLIALNNRSDEPTLKGPSPETLPGPSREILRNAYFHLLAIQEPPSTPLP